MTEEILLERVHHPHDVAIDGLGGGAIHQHSLGTEHLRHFGEQDGTACRRESIGDATDQRVRGDAAEPVGAAALVAEHQRGGWYRLASVVSHPIHELVQRRDARLHLVEHILRVEEADAAAVHVARFGEQGVELVVLAAETEHQHPPGIRVAHESREDLARVSEVVAKLAASIWMRERVDSVDDASEALVRRAGDLFGCPVDAADRVDDPDFVARADTAVSPLEALPRALRRRWRRRARERLVGIVERALELRLEVVRVDPSTRVDLRRDSADRPSVLVDDVTNPQRMQRDLVARGYLLAHRDGGVTDADRIARLERVDGDRDVVRRPDANGARDTRGRGGHAVAPARAVRAAPTRSSRAGGPTLYVSRASS